MPLVSTPAIVLNSMKLGEADRLITFFTEKRGKIKGVAQGARRMKSRFGASLEPFTHCGLVLFEKGGDKLNRVSQVDITRSFQSLRENLDQIEMAQQMTHLVSRLMADEEPNQSVWLLLLEGLTCLEEGINCKLSTLLFLIRLTTYVGYQPGWDHCMKCQSLIVREARHFSPTHGGVVCLQCAETLSSTLSLSAGTLALLKVAQKMEYRIAHRLRPSSSAIAEITQIYGNHLSHSTGGILSIKTKNWLWI